MHPRKQEKENCGVEQFFNLPALPRTPHRKPAFSYILGSTGNLPVPVGNLPTGMTNDTVPSKRRFGKNCSLQSSAGLAARRHSPERFRGCATHPLWRSYLIMPHPLWKHRAVELWAEVGQHGIGNCPAARDQNVRCQ